MKVVYVDKDRCLGCFNCERACALHRYRISGQAQSCIRVQVDLERRLIHTSTCRQCKRAPCARACPSGALSRDPNTGILAVDPLRCLGCGECAQACPFGNVRIIPSAGVAAKCDLCGGAPECVQSCQAQALHYGTLKDVLHMIRSDKTRNLVVRTVEDTESDS